MLQPVRSLPAGRALVSLVLLFFLAFSCIATAVVGFTGFDALSFDQKLTYYGVLTGLAFLFSIALVQEIRPGSRKLVSISPLVALALLLLLVLPFILFHNVSLFRFVPLGLPCLRLGSVCALVSGALTGLFLKNVFLLSPLSVSFTAGCFAGLIGFSVLALHCPIQDAAHVIVWHFGPILVGGVGGAIIGFIRQRAG